MTSGVYTKLGHSYSWAIRSHSGSGSEEVNLFFLSGGWWKPCSHMKPQGVRLLPPRPLTLLLLLFHILPPPPSKGMGRWRVWKRRQNVLSFVLLHPIFPLHWPRWILHKSEKPPSQPLFNVWLRVCPSKNVHFLMCDTVRKSSTEKRSDALETGTRRRL